ncbi:MAG: hypothetical protein LUQ71_07540 [Methanoregula sp.]|nr:hypothetical protein [Methanoregula sp.]
MGGWKLQTSFEHASAVPVGGGIDATEGDTEGTGVKGGVTGACEVFVHPATTTAIKQTAKRRL